MLTKTCRPQSAAGLIAAVLLAFLPAGGAIAQTAPPYESLLARLEQLPAAIQGRALADAAAARADQARALPNPSLTYEVENANGTGPYRGVDNADTIVTLSQPLEIWGQRAARVRAARADADAASLRGELTRSEVAAQLATAYAQAESALRRHALAAEALMLTRKDADAVSAMVTQGREPELRAVQARSETANARAVLEEATAWRDAALARLASAAVLGGPVRAIADSLLDRVPPTPRETVAEALTVRIAQAEADAAGRLVELERRRALPELGVSVGQTRFRESGDRAYTLGLSLSIPLFDRNRSGIQAAYADQRAADARVAQSMRESEAERLAAVAGLKASTSRTRAADESVVAAEEAYRLSRIGFDAGRIAQLELRGMRAALINARSAAVDARLARVVAEIDLARLEGRAPFQEK